MKAIRFAPLLALTLASPPVLAAEVGPATATYDVLRALPGADDGFNIEAVVAFKDVKRMAAFGRLSQERIMRFGPAKAYFDENLQASLLGFDLYTEFERLGKIAKPSGAPAGAAFVVFSSDQGGLNGQLVIGVEPGFLARLAAAKDELPFKVDIAGETLTVPLSGGVAISGKVDGNGWLRLAPDPSMLVEGTGQTTLFSGKLQAEFDSSDFAIAVRDGSWKQLIQPLMTEPGLGDALQFLDGAVLGMAFDGDKTSTFKLAVASKQLAALAPMVRRPDLKNWFANLWHRDALSMVSISLPPALLQQGKVMAREMAATVPQGQELSAMLDGFDGRIGLVGFGSPGDWGIALRYETPERAAEVASELLAMLQKVLDSLGVEKDELALRDPAFSKPETVFLLRADRALEGARVTHVGANVIIIPSKSRIEKMLAPDAEKNTLMATPLTPGVRETLNRPALMLAYLVMPGDGSYFDWWIWPAKMLELGFKEIAKSDDAKAMAIPGMSTLDGLKRLPLVAVLGGIGILVSYDVAIAVDVNADMARFEFTGSLL